jgi:streptomycin 3"-adenylyltransferase
MRDEELAQLDGVVQLVQNVLGAQAVGAYLFGSATSGGLRPRSDLDVLVVSRRPTTAEEKRRLVDGLLERSGRPRHLELTLVVARDVARWRYPPSYDLLYGDWLRGELERDDPPPGPVVSPDLTVLLAMVLRSGDALFGPPPGEVLAAVPPGDLVRASVDVVDGLLADLEPDTANVVLTLARIWVTVETGDVRSKDAAADWALERLPAEHRAVLERARSVYVGEVEDVWGDLAERIRPHAEHVVARIAQSRREEPSNG